MKKLILFSALLFVFATAKADKDKPIEVNQLPSKAQTFLQNYYPGVDVAMAKEEYSLTEKAYQVIFTNGTKVEFNRKGLWTDLECKKSTVPNAIIPTAIQQYAKTKYAGATITEIERERGIHKIKLSNGLEFKFDKNFRVIDIDN